MSSPRGMRIKLFSAIYDRRFSMTFIAHIDGDRIQTNKEHLYGTANLAGRFADSFGKREWGFCCGLLHDIGKYSLAFQNKIKIDSNRRVDHSTAGAKVSYRYRILL